MSWPRSKEVYHVGLIRPDRTFIDHLGWVKVNRKGYAQFPTSEQREEEQVELIAIRRSSDGAFAFIRFEATVECGETAQVDEVRVSPDCPEDLWTINPDLQKVWEEHQAKEKAS